MLTNVNEDMIECQVGARLVNKCMSTHVNANVSLESNANANAISRNAFKGKCFGYTFGNAFELVSNVLTLRCCIWRKKQCNVYKHIINLINKYNGTLL